jgi:hypothetical protein
MTSANALFDPLRIPRKIVVHYYVTKLEVQALGASLS